MYVTSLESRRTRLSKQTLQLNGNSFLSHSEESATSMFPERIFFSKSLLETKLFDNSYQRVQIIDIKRVMKGGDWLTNALPVYQLEIKVKKK